MKISILVLTALSLSMSAFAGTYGTPDQDPIVKDLRERFTKGKQPTAQQLLGKEFLCREIVAERNDFSKKESSTTLTFSSFDGYLQENLENSQSDGQLYFANGAEYIASMPSTVGVATGAFRIDNHGYLIFEWSADGSNLTPDAELQPVANALPNSRVISYLLCIPKP